jgi:hypothetical protein
MVYSSQAVAWLLVLSFSSEGTQATSFWREIQSREGKFQVLLPGKVESQTRSFATRAGKVKLVCQSAEHPSGGVYGISYADLPPAYVKKTGAKGVIKDIQAGILDEMSAKPTSETEITLGKHPGLEFRAPFKAMGVEGETHARVFVVGDRGYMLVVLGLKGAISDQKEVRKFMDSLKLTPEKK